MHFPLALGTLDFDKVQPCGNFARRWQFRNVVGPRNPLHLAPPIGDRASRQRHPFDWRLRHDDNCIVGSKRFLRLSKVLNICLRISRIIFRKAHERQILLLPEIGVADVDIVDGGALETRNVIALVQHV